MYLPATVALPGAVWPEGRRPQDVLRAGLVFRANIDSWPMLNRPLNPYSVSDWTGQGHGMVMPGGDGIKIESKVLGSRSWTFTRAALASADAALASAVAAAALAASICDVSTVGGAPAQAGSSILSANRMDSTVNCFFIFLQFQFI
jgi:hypothetical protein